jgi:hypothetical protein
MATVHGPPTIYERGQGLGFGYELLTGLVSSVCMAGLDSRIYMAGLVLGDQIRCGGQSGGTVVGVTGLARDTVYMYAVRLTSLC